MPRKITPSRLLAKLPVFFDLQDKAALVAGDDHEAMLPKVRLLAMAGARVHICTAVPSEPFEGLSGDAEPGAKIQFIEHHWQQLELKTFSLAIGAFHDPQNAAQFCQAARAARTPVNLVDKPALCDFQLPSIVNRSPLVIGISTNGAAPVFGQWLRGRLESLLPQGTGVVLEAASDLRAKVNAVFSTFSNPAQKREFWRKLAEDDLARLARMQPQEIKGHLLHRLEKATDMNVPTGRVWLISVPEWPEDMSLKVLRLLQNADVIFKTADVDDDYLDFARRDAERINMEAGTDYIQKVADQVASGRGLIWLHGQSGDHQSKTADALASANIDFEIL